MTFALLFINRRKVELSINGVKDSLKSTHLFSLALDGKVTISRKDENFSVFCADQIET